jgi:prepilin-type N-terminal cleavage/methylation domain-containing protein/prepilin-type processing-associated H-X9-DG protein
MIERRRALTLIELLIVLAIITVLFALTLSGVQNVRAASQRTICANQLRQVGLALQHAHDIHGRFPPGTHNQSSGPQPFASWITRILPQLDQVNAWREFEEDYRKEIKFVGPPQHRNLGRHLPVVLCPLEARSVATVEEGYSVAFTSYLGIAGKYGAGEDGILYLDSKVRIADITDGLSNTLMIGERPPSADLHYGWWYAGVGQQSNGSADYLMGVRELNLSFRAPTCPKGEYHFQPGRIDDMCATFHFWSLHPGGAHFAFCDGSVRFLHYSADRLLPALASRAGNEPAVLPE